MTHRIEIKPREAGPGVRFLVDGVDLANQLTGYTIRHEGIGPARIELELKPNRYDAELDAAVVDVTPELAELLAKLGWTPPTVAEEVPA